MKFQKREIPKGEGNGLFLRLKDGENRIGVFCGEVYEFFQIWESGKSQVVSEDHPGAKARFRLNFVSKEEGELKAKIFEFGLMVYNQLAEISEDYDLEKTAVKITRRGIGTDTTYMIMPAKDQPTLTQLKAIQAIDLNILNHSQQQTEKIKNQTNSDEVPF